MGGSPNTLTGADGGVPATIDAPGTGEAITQSLFARYLQPLLNAVTSLQIHKQDSSGSFALQSYVDDRVRTVRTVAKSHANSPYPVALTDEVIETDTTLGVLILQLPAPASGNRWLLVVDTAFQAGVNKITLSRNGGTYKIRGTAADYDLPQVSGGSWTVYTNGTDYWVMGSGL